MLKSLIGYLIVFFISFSSLSRAETLTLHSGEKVEGQIIKRTPLYVMMQAQRMTQTFYLGEIATIDGKKVEVSPSKPPAAALKERKILKIPSHNEEQEALVNFMNIRNAASKTKAKAPVLKTPASAMPKSVTPLAVFKKKKASSMPGMMGKMGGANKRIVPTADGGFVVISPEKMTKYDKDLNLVKKIDI